SAKIDPAAPQAADAAAKIVAPATKTFRRPKRSPAAPPTRRRDERSSRYASTTHWAPESVVESDRWRTGSATLTIVPSRIAIVDPAIAATSTQRRVLSAAFIPTIVCRDAARATSAGAGVGLYW